MKKLLIIGCGGVASVAIHKCCQADDVFGEIMIASRTKSKCDALKAKLEGTTRTKISTAQVDADDVQQLCALIRHTTRHILFGLFLALYILPHFVLSVLFCFSSFYSSFIFMHLFSNFLYASKYISFLSPFIVNS